MKRIKLFEHFVNESYDEIMNYTGALDFPDSAKDALAEVIESIFKKPKYKKTWVKGQYGHCTVDFSFKPNPDRISKYSISLVITPEGFLLNPPVEELDKMVKKYGNQWTYGGAVGEAVESGKISKKEIKGAIKELERFLDRIISREN